MSKMWGNYDTSVLEVSSCGRFLQRKKALPSTDTMTRDGDISRPASMTNSTSEYGQQEDSIRNESAFVASRGQISAPDRVAATFSLRYTLEKGKDTHSDRVKRTFELRDRLQNWPRSLGGKL